MPNLRVTPVECIVSVMLREPGRCEWCVDDCRLRVGRVVLHGRPRRLVYLDN